MIIITLLSYALLPVVNSTVGYIELQLQGAWESIVTFAKLSLHFAHSMNRGLEIQAESISVVYFNNYY